MRDPHEKHRNRRLTKGKTLVRRAALTSALLLTAPTLFADQPGQTSSVRIVPPLPLPVRGVEVQSNPYYQPPVIGEIKATDFANSERGTKSAIKLKAIGNAIGLQPIQAGKPTQIRPPALVIETPAPRVRMNPLINNETIPPSALGSNELPPAQNSQQLVPALRISSSPDAAMISPLSVANQQAIPTTETLGSSRPGPQSPIVENVILQPSNGDGRASEHSATLAETDQESGSADTSNQPSDFDSVVESDGAAPVPSNPVVGLVEIAPVVSEPIPEPIIDANLDSEDHSVIVSSPLNSSKSVEISGDKAKVEMIAEDRNVNVESIHETKPVVVESSEPIVFSMSDSSLKSNGLGSKSRGNGSGLQPVAVPTVDSKTPGPIVALAQPPGLDSSDQLEMAPAPSPSRSQGPVNNSDAFADAAFAEVDADDPMRPLLSRSSYRPPVKVGLPPMAHAVDAEQPTTVGPVLHNPVALALAPTESEKPKKQRQPRVVRPKPVLTKLHLNRAQVRSLTIGGVVRRVNVSDQDVCQAIAAGPNQVKLIGTGYGVTRLVVWADTSDDAPTKTKTFEIHVEDAVENNGTSAKSKTEVLNRSILRAFPNANISVHQMSDRLLVSGECDSEDDARKIIRMVRKTCLIPVRDEIKVR